MSSIEDFDRSVKAALAKGKPLSSSTVEGLVKLAMSNVASDAQLVSTLYKHHKRASSTCKIYSLYLIDAIARDARSQAKKAAKGKDKQDASASSSTAAADGSGGTCATFLSKLEAVLSKLVVDCWENGQKEHREKVRKVVDIWSKAGTFSSSSLARINTKLAAINSDVSKDPAASPTVPKGSTTPTDAPSAAVNGLPASVAALLATSTVTQPPATPLSVTDEVERAVAAARAGVARLPSPTPQPPPPTSLAFDPSIFDPAKLASLQQVLSGATNPTPPPVPSYPPSQPQQHQQQQSYGAPPTTQHGYGGAGSWEQGQQGGWGAQGGGGWSGQQSGGISDGWGNGGGRGEYEDARGGGGGWQGPGRGGYGQQEQHGGRQQDNGHGGGQYGRGGGSFDGGRGGGRSFDGAGRGGFEGNRGGFQRDSYNGRTVNNYSTGPSSREQSANPSVDPRSRPRSPSPSSSGAEQPPRKRRWDAPAAVDPPIETRAPLPSRPEPAPSPPPETRPPPPSRPGGAESWEDPEPDRTPAPSTLTPTSVAAPPSHPTPQHQPPPSALPPPRVAQQPLDFASFDPTSPASWEAFAPMLLQMNGGVMPSTEMVCQWIAWQMQMNAMQAMGQQGMALGMGQAQGGEQGEE